MNILQQVTLVTLTSPDFRFLLMTFLHAAYHVFTFCLRCFHHAQRYFAVPTNNMIAYHYIGIALASMDLYCNFA
jgi:hypothetical protein